MLFDVCSTCSAGLANDDWSHLDYWDRSGDSVAAAMASIEAMGMVAPVDSVAYAFDCFVCSGVVYGGTTWERI